MLGLGGNFKNVLFEIAMELFSFLKLVGKGFTSMKEKRQTEHKATRRNLA